MPDWKFDDGRFGVLPVSTIGTLMPLRGTLDVDLVRLRHGPNPVGTLTAEWPLVAGLTPPTMDRRRRVRLPFQACSGLSIRASPLAWSNARLTRGRARHAVKLTSNDCAFALHNSATRDWLLSRSTHPLPGRRKRTGRSIPPTIGVKRRPQASWRTCLVPS